MSHSDGSDACLRFDFYLLLKTNRRAVLKEEKTYDYIDLQSDCTVIPRIYCH